jgi:hypothetical protein
MRKNEAKERAYLLGLKQYVTPDKPCCRGHTSPRRVDTGACIECLRHHMAKYYQKNREARLKYQRDNLHRTQELIRKRREINPDKYKQQALAYSRKRMTRPEVKVSNRVRVQMHKLLRGGKGGRRWEELVGYSKEMLKVHLEKQFTKGMCWENMGEWHIDHIVPLSSFNFSTPEDPDFRRAWALTNLRPLWASENIAKHARRTLLL